MTAPEHTDYPAIGKAGRISALVWSYSSRLMPGRSAQHVNAFCKLVRPGRVTMVTLLTFVSASIVDLATRDIVLITLGGMSLAMAGFAIDVYSDREVDKDGPRAWPINPISTGMMSAKSAERWIGLFVAAGLFLCFSVHPLTLLPAFVLLTVFWGLASGVFDGPIGRMVTLGLLQALYVLLAAAATGTFPLFMIMIAIVLLAAMSGARVVADIRDLPSDVDTDTVTVAKAYGIEKSKWILPITMTLAFGLGLALYPISPFDQDYLIWTVIGFGVGLVLAWVFVFNPTPNLAFKLGLPFWGAGILYMVALFLGSR